LYTSFYFVAKQLQNTSAAIAPMVGKL